MADSFRACSNLADLMARLLRILRIASIVLLAVVAYWNAAGNDFVYDDGAQILRNHYIRDTSHLRQIWTTNVWSFMGPHAISNYYRPMMHMSFMAEYALFGYAPARFHAGNIFLHALNSVLVLAVGEALLFPAFVAYAAALLFAVHPMGTEAVTWVAGLPDLAYSLFFLLSLWIYVRVRPPVRRGLGSRVAGLGSRVSGLGSQVSGLRSVAGENPAGAAHPWHPAWLALSVVAALLALFSKETALVLLPAIVIYEHLFRAPGLRSQVSGLRSQVSGPRSQVSGASSQVAEPGATDLETAAGRRPSAWNLRPWTWDLGPLRFYLGHVAATAFYLVMRIRSLGGFQVATNPYGVISPAAFVFSVIWLFGKYVWKLIAPAPFNIFYMFYPARSLFEWRVLAGLVVLAAVSAAAWLLWRRGQALAFAFVILLLPLVPVMDMRAIGHNIFTERYLYLPMAGFCWLVAAALERLYSRRAALAVALLVLLAANYVLLTRSRNAEWHDNITLYTATLLVAPDANLIRGNLGEAYLEGAGRPDLALAEFRECVRRMPDRPEYYCKVGEALGELRRYNQALASLDRSLALWPNYPEAFLARGDVCREMGDEEAAERAYSRALEIKPGYSEAHVALGALRRAQGRLSEAEASFRLALKFTDIAAAHLNLGLLYLAQARYPEAEAAFRHVLVSEAHSVAAWDGLGKALAAQGKPSEAAACFRTALNERRWAHPRRLGRTPVPDQADLEQDLAATEHPKRI